jgi:hypothetical protein
MTVVLSEKMQRKCSAVTSFTDLWSSSTLVNSSFLASSLTNELERVMGLEPTTFCLGSRHSTAELHPHSGQSAPILAEVSGNVRTQLLPALQFRSNLSGDCGHIASWIVRFGGLPKAAFMRSRTTFKSACRTWV